MLAGPADIPGSSRRSAVVMAKRPEDAVQLLAVVLATVWCWLQGCGSTRRCADGSKAPPSALAPAPSPMGNPAAPPVSVARVPPLATPVVVLRPMVSTALCCQLRAWSVSLCRHDARSCVVWNSAYSAVARGRHSPQNWQSWNLSKFRHRSWP